MSNEQKDQFEKDLTAIYAELNQIARFCNDLGPHMIQIPGGLSAAKDFPEVFYPAVKSVIKTATSARQVIVERLDVIEQALERVKAVLPPEAK